MGELDKGSVGAYLENMVERRAGWEGLGRVRGSCSARLREGAGREEVEEQLPPRQLVLVALQASCSFDFASSPSYSYSSTEMATIPPPSENHYLPNVQSNSLALHYVKSSSVLPPPSHLSS